MDVLEKIEFLRKQKGWILNKLAYESTLTPSTLANMFYRNTQPTIKTLSLICDAFNISLAEFFADDVVNKDNLEKEELWKHYNKLNAKQIEECFKLGIFTAIIAEPP